MAFSLVILYLKSALCKAIQLKAISTSGVRHERLKYAVCTHESPAEFCPELSNAKVPSVTVAPPGCKGVKLSPSSRKAQPAAYMDVRNIRLDRAGWAWNLRSLQ